MSKATPAGPGKALAGSWVLQAVGVGQQIVCTNAHCDTISQIVRTSPLLEQGKERPDQRCRSVHLQQPLSARAKVAQQLLRFKDLLGFFDPNTMCSGPAPAVPSLTCEQCTSLLMRVGPSWVLNPVNRPSVYRMRRLIVTAPAQISSAAVCLDTPDTGVEGRRQRGISVCTHLRYARRSVEAWGVCRDRVHSSSSSSRSPTVSASSAAPGGSSVVCCMGVRQGTATIQPEPLIPRLPPSPAPPHLCHQHRASDTMPPAAGMTMQPATATGQQRHADRRTAPCHMHSPGDNSGRPTRCAM